MKHLPTPRRVDADDSVVQGMEAGFALVLFLALGYVIDRWLGTAPVFTIAMVVVGSVGLFVRFKYTYIARMERLEADRLDRRAAGHRSTTSDSGSRTGSQTGPREVA
jgi:hypothetical protein